jgi:hypothetical protein
MQRSIIMSVGNVCLDTIRQNIPIAVVVRRGGENGSFRDTLNNLTQAADGRGAHRPAPNRLDASLHKGHHLGRLMEFNGEATLMSATYTENLIAVPRSPYLGYSLEELRELMRVNHKLADFIAVFPKCYVFNKLDDINDILADTDFSGMSDVEIYNLIHGLYTEAFGDFEEMRAIKGGWGEELFHMNWIESSFNVRMLSIFGNRSKIESVFREAHFSGMSDTEIRTAIRNQFPANPTLRDMKRMSYLMGQAGVHDLGFSNTIHYYAMEFDRASRVGEDPMQRVYDFLANMDRPMNWTLFRQVSENIREVGLIKDTIDQFMRTYFTAVAGFFQ